MKNKNKTERNEMEKLLVLLQQIALAPFFGNKGIRGDVINNQIRLLGGKPYNDDYGNLRVVKGSGKKRILIDAHMDTVFGLQKRNYFFKQKNSNIQGCLDNSVGCAIALQLFELLKVDAELNFVFSIDEEIGGRGATHVIRSEKKDFDFCITLDATFPGENGTQVFCENFSSRKFMAEFSNINFPAGVEARNFNFPDNGSIYSRRWNSVSICPVVFGNMHSSNCWTKTDHLQTAVNFCSNLIKEVL